MTGATAASAQPSGTSQPAPSRKQTPAPPSEQSRGARRKQSRGRKPSAARPDVATRPWSLEQYQVPPVEGKTRFHDVGIPLQVMHGLADLKFEYCTPVQAEVLTRACEGQNIAAQAQTGTGKTAAFMIRIFSDFMAEENPEPSRIGRPRALVLAPTRELCMQIVKDAEAIGRYTPYRTVAVYGGMDYEKQKRSLLDRPVDVVAATPGRLLDFLGKGVLKLSNVQDLVLDEADRMLDMGFIPDVRRIIRCCPPREQRRTLLFSATLSDTVRRLASQWMRDPVEVDIEPENVAVDTVDQIVYTVPSRQKLTLLRNLLKDPAFSRVLVFGNRRDRTQRLADRLRKEGVACALLSGAVEQRKRIRILDDFRAGKLRVLVATDVAGRGIHVDEISHVINFELPYEPEDYVHRIGRTGRAGLAGTAISFACEDESFIIPDIEAFIGRSLPCRQPDEHLLKR